MNKFLHNAQEYTAHRPQYPSSMYDYLASLVSKKNVLLDCGTGSGQAARDLTKYFENIIATDLSFELLKSAPKITNLIYVQAEAEYLPLQSKKVDMITISQALHWFLLDKFYGEVNRILKPKGIIAAWCYNQCVINY